jgi:hypothetical protein
MVVNPYLIELHEHTNEKGGCLVAIENIGFDIKRVFYIYGTNETTQRGFHGHKNTTQILISITGSVDIDITNCNGSFYTKLSSPITALIMPPDNYIVMKNFSKGSILLALADTEFQKDIVYVKTV